VYIGCMSCKVTARWPASKGMRVREYVKFRTSTPCIWCQLYFSLMKQGSRRLILKDYVGTSWARSRISYVRLLQHYIPNYRHISWTQRRQKVNWFNISLVVLSCPFFLLHTLCRETIYRKCYVYKSYILILIVFNIITLRFSTGRFELFDTWV